MSIKLIADRHIPLLAELFDSDVDLEWIDPAQFSNQRIKQADAIAVRSRTTVNPALLQNTAVRLVASSTSGMDHIDQAALAPLGIACVDAKGCNAPAVAEYIVATIATLRLEQILSTQALRVGVIGMGHVGRLVANSLSRLGFDVIQCDPLRALLEPEFSHTPINELQNCDILTLHTPLTNTGPYPTVNLIIPSIIRAQQSGCVVINSARGEVLPLEVVLACANDARFVFDVYPGEPLFDKHFLDAGILTTPHIAGNVIESKLRGAMMIALKICDHFHLSKRRLHEVPWPQSQVILVEKQWETAVLNCYQPRVDHAALQAIKILNEDEFVSAYHHLREGRALRREYVI